MYRTILLAIVAACVTAVVGQVGITTKVSIAERGLEAEGDSSQVAVTPDGRFVVYASDSSDVVARDNNGVRDVFIFDKWVGTTRRVSVSTDGDEANAACNSPDVSADGRFVVFHSAATNLVPMDTNGVSDVFMHEIPSGNTIRVSVNSGGIQGNGSSTSSVVSDDGSSVVYASAATNLVAGDTNAVTDIFKLNLTTAITTRVSVSTGGTQANGPCADAVVSSDGRYVAFYSSATNLVAGDTNAEGDVFRRDTQSPTTIRISVHSNGTQGNGLSRFPAISANGSFVAFRSAATNLVSGDTNGANDVFRRDVSTQTTVRVSVSSANAQANGASSNPSISSDGRYIAFDSVATNLVTDDTNSQNDVFRRDVQSSATVRASLSTQEAQGNGASDSPAITGSGNEIAFISSASNMLFGDTNAADDGFVRDIGAGATQRVTVRAIEGNDDSLRCSIDSSGRYVAFLSRATNFMEGSVAGRLHVYVRDRLLQTTERASESSGGVAGNDSSFGPAISADGRFVAFESDATNLVLGDNNGLGDVFVHDRVTGTTTRVSVSTAGTEGNGESREPSISGDGRYVAFSSSANNLVAGDTNSADDVFVRDRTTNQTFRVSVTSAEAQANSVSGAASISFDGNLVAFDSFASNLVAGDTNGFIDVFVRDIQAGTTSRVSVSTAGTQGNAESSDPHISGDGTSVAFSSWASNLVSSDTNTELDVFVRDRVVNVTRRASISSGGTQGNDYSNQPKLDFTGDLVVFTSRASNLVAGDTNFWDDIFSHSFITFQTRRLSVSTSGEQGDGICTSSATNATGLATAFQSGSGNLVLDDDNGYGDIFVRDSALTPTVFDMVRGNVESGDAGSVMFPENERIDIKPGVVLVSNQPPIEIVVERLSPTNTVSTLVFSIEANATSAAIRQTIFLYNFDTNQYEQVDARQSTVTDTRVDITITNNPGRFVGASNHLRSKITYKASGPVLVYPWRARLDHLNWVVFN
jgi:hypothetical protein